MFLKSGTYTYTKYTKNARIVLLNNGNSNLLLFARDSIHVYQIALEIFTIVQKKGTMESFSTMEVSFEMGEIVLLIFALMTHW